MHYRRRSSEKDGGDPWLPPLRWAFLESKTALAAVFAIAFIWFSRCVPALQPIVARAVASSPATPAFSLGAEREGFAMTSACVHTLLVGLGLAAGKDTLLGSGPLNLSRVELVLCSVSFCLLALMLGLSFSYEWRPVHTYASCFYPSALPFAIIGAFSVTLWLAVSMLFPHLRVGHAFKGNVRLHAGLIALALLTHVVDVPGPTCLSGFGCLAGATYVAERMPRLRIQDSASF